MQKLVTITNLRPNNWYLSQEKLDKIRALWSQGRESELPPVLVTEIDGEYCLVDGHSRAFVALEKGQLEIPAHTIPLSQVDGPLELYVFLHRAGPERGIERLEHLSNRILGKDEYQDHWIGFCENLIEDELLPELMRSNDYPVS